MRRRGGADGGWFRLAAGHAAQAETLLRPALEIFQRMGAAEAAGVSAELDAVTAAQPAAPGS